MLKEVELVAGPTADFAGASINLDTKFRDVPFNPEEVQQLVGCSVLSCNLQYLSSHSQIVHHAHSQFRPSTFTLDHSLSFYRSVTGLTLSWCHQQAVKTRIEHMNSPTALSSPSLCSLCHSTLGGSRTSQYDHQTHNLTPENLVPTASHIL